jgi:hypothetical protein
MRLYRLNWLIETKIDDNQGSHVRYHQQRLWCGSQKECAALRRKIRQREGYVPNSVQTAPINVPTTKDKLIAFLNREKLT